MKYLNYVLYCNNYSFYTFLVILFIQTVVGYLVSGAGQTNL